MTAAANLRTRWRELLATVLAVAVGVGLLGAVLLTAGAARPPVQERLSATSALVVPPRVAESRTPRSDGLVPWPSAGAAAVADRLAATPGTTAVPDRSFPAVPLPGGIPAGDPEDREGGHGTASLALGGYRIVEGGPPSVPGEAVVGAHLGLRPGAELPVLFADAVRPVRVTGVTDGPGVYLTDAEAARLAPGVRTIGVLGPVPSASQVPPGAAVLTGDDRGAVEPVQDSRVRYRGDQLLAALGLLTGVTTVVVGAAALSTAVAGRRRELGLLRAVGATPGQVRRVVLAEAALVGAAGAALGTVLAAVLGPALYRALVAADAARPVGSVPVTPGPLFVAATAGIVLALGGGLAASRTAARAIPLDAVTDRGPAGRAGRPRLVTGLVVAAGGAGLAILTAGAEGDGRIGLALAAGAVLVVAAALLAPVVIALPGGLAAVSSRRARTRGSGPLSGGAMRGLVRAGLSSAPARSAAVAAPAVVAVGFAVLIGGLVDTMAAAYPAQRTAVLAGSVAVEQAGAPGMPDATARALSVPGARVPLPTVLVLRGPAGPTAVDAVGTADAALVRPGEVVLSEPVAAGLGVVAGDVLPVRFADGSDPALRVSRVLPPDERRGDVAVARDDVRVHDPAALTDTAFLPSGAVPDPPPAGVTVRDAQSYALADYAVDARLTDALAALLVAVSSGYGGLAVVNGIASAARSRRPDLAVLAAAGATPGKRIAMAAGEAGAATLVGVVLGVAVTVAPLLAVASGLSVATGAPVAVVIGPGTVALAAGACLAAAVGTSAVVTARAGRS
jgi:putative ABC transport system permease protein